MKKFLLLGAVGLMATAGQAGTPLPFHVKDASIKKVPAKVSANDGYVLYENFSGWNGKKKNWIPDGWSIDHKGECSTDYTWQPLNPSEYDPTAIDGDYYFSIGASQSKQDEWLISPRFTPKPNMEISYHMYLYPMYFYATENLDWGTKEYIGGKQTVFTIQVMIQEGEAGEWKPLRDYAEEFMDYSYQELRAVSSRTMLQKQTIGLDDYAGKDVRLAFRYLGADGDVMMIDAIGVGYPTLEDVWYLHPTSSLYWGFTRNSNFQQMPFDIAFHPVNAPITWTNMSEEDATYSWDLIDKEECKLIDEDEYELSVSFPPVRPEAIPTLYDSPTLLATAEERIDKEYHSTVECFQTGGEPSYTAEGEKMEFTLFQFPINTQDIAFKDVRDSKLGAYSIPVFGYNEFSDDYWLNYSLNGEERKEGNFNHLIGIGNIFFPSDEAPLVVNGMSVYGYGRMDDDVELTATIYALDEEMHSDFNTFTEVAKATATGKDIEALYDKRFNDYIYIPFQFDTPAVVRASEEHPAFIFMLEGFRSEKVSYFAPLQSYLPNPSRLCNGYMLSEINLQGHTEQGTYRSLKSMQYMEDGKYLDFAGTFAIGLDAEYPWLISAVEAIELGEDMESVSVALDSYYDSSVLTVEAPEGLAASVSGQYDECVLTVSRTESSEVKEGSIKISAPGLELEIPVNAGNNAVSVIGGDNEVMAIYDLSGRRVSSVEAKGIYIVKYSNGQTRKVSVE